MATPFDQIIATVSNPAPSQALLAMMGGAVKEAENVAGAVASEAGNVAARGVAAVRTGAEEAARAAAETGYTAQQIVTSVPRFVTERTRGAIEAAQPERVNAALSNVPVLGDINRAGQVVGIEDQIRQQSAEYQQRAVEAEQRGMTPETYLDLTTRRAQIEQLQGQSESIKQQIVSPTVDYRRIAESGMNVVRDVAAVAPLALRFTPAAPVAPIVETEMSLFSRVVPVQVGPITEQFPSAREMGMGVYEVAHRGAEWWGENINQPFERATSPLTESTMAKQVESGIEGARPYANVLLATPLAPIVPLFSQPGGNPLILDTPSKLSEASRALVGVPGQMVEFGGMAAGGAGVLAENPAAFPALATAGLFMQGQGIEEGLRTRPTGFIYEQMGMIALTEGGVRVIGRASPIGGGALEVPAYAKGEAPSTFYAVYSKMPFAAEGGQPRFMAGIADIPSAKVPFVGSPTGVLKDISFRITPSMDTTSGPWTNIQHAVFDKYLIENLPKEQARIIETSGPAVRAAYSKLFAPQQREPFGEVPTTSASRQTVENVISAWEQMGTDIVHGGSRSQRAWVGAAGKYESMFGSDFDTYSRNVKEANFAYHRATEEVAKQYPNVEEMRGTHPATSRDITKVQASIITKPKEEFIHIKPFSAYEYMRELPPVKMEAIGGKTAVGINPRLLFKRSVAGMFSEVVQERASGIPELAISRAKDIAAAYPMSRSFAETLYQPSFVDVGGTVTKAKVARATALEEYSTALREYVPTLPKAERMEVETMLGEARTDWLRGVERQPSPTIDIITGKGWLDRPTGGWNEEAVLFRGKSSRFGTSIEELPRGLESLSMTKEMGRRLISGRAAEEYPSSFTRPEKYPKLYPIKAQPIPKAYPSMVGYPKLGYPSTGYPSDRKYPTDNYPTGFRPSISRIGYPSRPDIGYPDGYTTEYPTGTDIGYPTGYDTGHPPPPYPRPSTEYPPGYPTIKYPRRGALYPSLPTGRVFPPPPSTSIYYKKKTIYGKKKKSQKFSDWYIWNPTASLGTVFGLDIPMPWASARKIMSMQFKYPGPGNPRRIPAYFSERPRF